MKKYLFILFLFLIYIILKLSPIKKQMSYELNNYNNSYVYALIYFNNGINSYDLKQKLSSYDFEYYINKIKVNDNMQEVSCSKLIKCLNQLYSINTLEFEEKYLINGFKITEIYIISDKQKLEKNFKNNDIKYISL